MQFGEDMFFLRSFFVVIFAMLGLTLKGENKMSNESPIKFIKPTNEELKKKLTPEQYSCTQEEGTERPFHNKYWNNHDDGVYVDIISGEALFSSLDKFDSGSGWPSFTKPLDPKNLGLKKDTKLGVERIEVRSKMADSHLGHVFDDGPSDAGGKRFCINSAALKFIPLEKLKENQLGQYLFLFAKKKNWDVATLSGGCFWGVEELIRSQPGVIETVVGYTGGKTELPTYNLVKTGTSGYAESVQVLFDPKKLTYENLLLLFFKLHDPTTSNRQGNDVGTQYRSAIFYENEDQHRVAERIKEKVERSGAWKKPIVTEIVKASQFWSAEDYHQKYLQKNSGGYTCHFIRDIKF
jgi:peptide methionine sulfoxide reductase msrA/msrB